jgi:transcriptional regulator with XRE-family HTH domain
VQDQREPTPRPEALLAEHLFAAAAREARRARNMSQTALAEALAQFGIELDATAITRIERRTRTIRLAEAVAIGSILGISLDALAAGPQLERRIRAAQSRVSQAEAELANATHHRDEARRDLEELHERLNRRDRMLGEITGLMNESTALAHRIETESGESRIELANQMISLIERVNEVRKALMDIDPQVALLLSSALQ